MDEQLSWVDTIKQENDPVKKARLIEHEKRNGVRIKEIASALGMQSSYVCHLLRLLRLPPLIIDGFYAHSITLSHLFIISRLKNPVKMVQAYETVLSKSYNALQTEQFVRESLFHVNSDGDRIPKDELYSFAFAFHELFPEGKATVVQTRIRGKIILEVKGNMHETGMLLRMLMAKLRKGAVRKNQIAKSNHENLKEMDSQSHPSSVVENSGKTPGL